MIFLKTLLWAYPDSCSYSISGKILDISTKEPIPYVSVMTRDGSRGTIANDQGEFFLDSLCSKSNTLFISCYGYCDSICEHHHQHGKVPHIYLTQKVIDVGEVTIKAPMNKKEGIESIAQTTIDKDEINSDPTQTLAGVIEDEQGVSLLSAGTNVQMPVIHGLYGNRVLILNNGLKHGFQNWGKDHAPEIDIANANSITIVKGAAGVQFGPEALGGAIIVESNPLYLKEPFYALVRTGYQTNGRGYNSGFECGQGKKHWSYFINGNYTKVGDRHAPNYSLTNSGKEEYSFGSGVHFRTEKLGVKAYYSLINQNLGLLRASYPHSSRAIRQAFEAEQPDSSYILPFSYTINEPNQLIQHHLAKGEVKWNYSNHGNLKLIMGKQLNSRKEYDVRRNSHKPIIDLDLITNDIQLEWKHPDVFELDGVIGVQYYYQDNDNNPGTGTTPLIPNYNIDRYSAFVVESKRIGNDMIEAGIRIDLEEDNVRGRETNQDLFRDEFSFSNITSSLGFVKNFSKANSFRMNIGNAWRTPNMAELFSFGQHGFKTTYGLLRHYFDDEGKIKTNRVIPFKESEVEAEKGWKYVNELRINTKRHGHTLTAYSHYILNYIYEQPYGITGSFRGPQPVFIIRQTDALFLGCDYDWKAEWSKHVDGTFGVSYLWSRNLSKNESLINQPPVTMSYKLNWEHKPKGKMTSSKIIFKPFYRFEQFQAPRTVTPTQLIDGDEIITSNAEIFDFKAAPEGYFMFNIAWQFEWRKIQGRVAVNNLFNSSYRDYLNEMRYFADAPGRNFLFTLTYKFKNNQSKY